MYIPKSFEVIDQDEIFAFIENNSFGQIISNAKERFVSTHIPFLVSEDRTKLIGHVAKQNPHSESLEGQQVLVTLQGPHGYISPSWYNSSGVPTWNYQAVHIYGQCKLFCDGEKLSETVNMLTRKYESRFDNPWQPKYKQSLVQAIVGLEVTISEVECKYKLGQNRSTQDQNQMIEQLKLNGSKVLAEAMEKTLVLKSKG